MTSHYLTISNLSFFFLTNNSIKPQKHHGHFFYCEQGKSHTLLLQNVTSLCLFQLQPHWTEGPVKWMQNDGALGRAQKTVQHFLKTSFLKLDAFFF